MSVGSCREEGNDARNERSRVRQGVVQTELTGSDCVFYVQSRQAPCNSIPRRLLLAVRDDTVKERHTQ